MVDFQISVPSKTFLLGEYAVLNQGPGITIATLPRFELSLLKQPKKGRVEGIAAESPGGKYMKAYPNVFNNYVVEFRDYHQGKGGFGASSAQFLMLTAFRHHLMNESLETNFLLDEFIKFSSCENELAPSGVDVIGQMYGNICFYHKRNHILKNFSWSFNDIDYCLIHTGKKLNTHTHLRNFKTVDTTDLEEITLKGLQSFEESNSKVLTLAIQIYASLMKEKMLVTEHTQKMLDKLKTSEILAAKGCGALGADVILIIYERGNHEVITWLKNQNFDVIAYGRRVEPGINICAREMLNER